jgi:HD-GYP domain-containing protein (c-di-GMP phosphodiesterase class II)
MNPGKGVPALCVVGGQASADPASMIDKVLRSVAQSRDWPVRVLEATSSDEMDENVALVLLMGAGSHGARRQFPHALITSMDPGAKADLVAPGTANREVLAQLVSHAEVHWRRNLKVMELFREVAARRQRMGQLSEIALSLSTQVGFDELLETILLEARRLADCDAGSLYLIDDDDDSPSLIFKLAQNDSVTFPFIEQHLALSSQSLAGYVALSGEALDIPNAYEIPEDAPYQFNRSFDEQMGYRTRSILVLPMRDHRDQIVGVLQFINRLDPTRSEPIAFGEEMGELLRAVASQAAVSIQKNQLIRDVNRLFESFVQASVKAIEQRDPSTSGHSFRVAESTIALLEVLPKSGLPRFRDLTLSAEHLKEVRYAALLHDFGKVGVRENILLKANKLTDDRLEVIHYRLELQKERLRRGAVEKELELLHHGAVDIEVARRRVYRELELALSTLDAYFQCIVKANAPTVLDEDEYAGLREIREHAYRELDGTAGGLLSELELIALSVRKGNLTPDERREIESHVTHTRDFLSVLPWPPELAGVPEIAGAHHERVDGSGYPAGLIGEQIPLASRVMTVCDIYDALTAMDRPYKQAVTPQAALGILEDEARRGLLDVDMVRIFVDSRLYERVWTGNQVSQAAV